MSNLTVTVNGTGLNRHWLYLTPGDLTRADIEWVGVVERSGGDLGALGRFKSTGRLVQVNAGVVRTLDERAVEAALAAARAIERIALLDQLRELERAVSAYFAHQFQGAIPPELRDIHKQVMNARQLQVGRG